jgi:hypothetical protein
MHHFVSDNRSAALLESEKNSLYLVRKQCGPQVAWNGRKQLFTLVERFRWRIRDGLEHHGRNLVHPQAFVLEVSLRFMFGRPEMSAHSTKCLEREIHIVGQKIMMYTDLH